MFLVSLNDSRLSNDKRSLNDKLSSNDIRGRRMIIGAVPNFEKKHEKKQNCKISHENEGTNRRPSGALIVRGA